MSPWGRRTRRVRRSACSGASMTVRGRLKDRAAWFSDPVLQTAPDREPITSRRATPTGHVKAGMGRGSAGRSARHRARQCWHRRRRPIGIRGANTGVAEDAAGATAPGIGVVAGRWGGRRDEQYRRSASLAVSETRSGLYGGHAGGGGSGAGGTGAVFVEGADGGGPGGAGVGSSGLGAQLREPARTMAGRMQAHTGTRSGYATARRSATASSARGPPASLLPRPAAQFPHAVFNDGARHATMRASFPGSSPLSWTRPCPKPTFCKPASTSSTASTTSSLGGNWRRSGRRCFSAGPASLRGSPPASRGPRTRSGTLRSTCLGSWSNRRSSMPRTAAASASPSSPRRAAPSTRWPPTATSRTTPRSVWRAPSSAQAWKRRNASSRSSPANPARVRR